MRIRADQPYPIGPIPIHHDDQHQEQEPKPNGLPNGHSNGQHIAKPLKQSKPFRKGTSVLGPPPTVDRSRDSGPETIGISIATHLEPNGMPNGDGNSPLSPNPMGNPMEFMDQFVRTPSPRPMLSKHSKSVKSLKSRKSNKSMKSTKSKSMKSVKSKKSTKSHPSRHSNKSDPIPPLSPLTPPQKKELLSPSLRPSATASRSGRSRRTQRHEHNELNHLNGRSQTERNEPNGYNPVNPQSARSRSARPIRRCQSARNSTPNEHNQLNQQNGDHRHHQHTEQQQIESKHSNGIRSNRIPSKRSKSKSVKRCRSRSPLDLDPQLFNHSIIRTVSVHGPNTTVGSTFDLSPSPDYICDATPSRNSDKETKGDPLKSALLDVREERPSRHHIVEYHGNSTHQMEQRRHRVEEEMISTEDTFCRGLDTLLNELLLPMFDRKLIDRKYYRHCVSSVPQMLRFHRKLLDKLRAVHLDQEDDGYYTDNGYRSHGDRSDDQNGYSESRSVAEVLSRMIGEQRAQFTSIYLKYIAEYNAILELFGTTFHGNKKLNQFLKARRKGVFVLSFYGQTKRVSVSVYGNVAVLGNITFLTLCCT